MAEHNDLGQRGEALAVDFLKNKGYKIRAINWRKQYKEIDIIAEQGDFVVFVEVKSRFYPHHENPGDLLTRKKQRFLLDAADDYIQEEDLDLEARFDLIEVNFWEKPIKILHIEEAFTPSF